MVHFMKMKYTKLIFLYIVVFLTLCHIFSYDEMVAIVLRAQPSTSFYLYFICIQFFWAYYFYILIYQYHQLYTFIHIRISHNQYTMMMSKKFILLAISYMVIHIILFAITMHTVPIIDIILHIMWIYFSSLFFLYRFFMHKYSFIYMIILILLLSHIV